MVTPRPMKRSKAKNIVRIIERLSWAGHVAKLDIRKSEIISKLQRVNL